MEALKWDKIDSVYFIGIGGIGMSALARWFKTRGKRVAGYDKTSTPLTKELEQEGIWIHYEDKYKEIPDAFKEKQWALVVYTPAIPADHGELNYFQKKNFTLLKRSEVLGLISREHYCVGIAGTHGKTTTSSMLAHILNQSAKGCSAFVGGIMTNYESNLIIGSEDAPVVVEADEFDRSFLRLSPDYAVVTSVDPDHLDIYGDESQMHEGFGAYIAKVPEDGKVLIHHKAATKISKYLENLYYTYGIDHGDYQAKALRGMNGVFYFNYHGLAVIKDLALSVPGFHNVENAVAAITVALSLGVSSSEIKDAIASYRGVKRRFEYHIRENDLIYIDDYAHHPTEINAFLRSVKSIYPRKKLTAVFQPHLYTRTRDFYKGFAESLNHADEVFLLDIYPAREKPIKGVDSEMILNEMMKSAKQVIGKDKLIGALRDSKPEVLVTIGAGDIDQIVPQIVKEFKVKAEKGN